MTDISSSSQNFLSRLREKGYAQFKPTSPFMENFDQAFNIGVYEDMSISRNRVMKSHKKKRLQTIMEANKDGTIPDSILAGFRTRGGGPWTSIEADLLARYAKKHYGLDIQTDEDIKKNIREDLAIVKHGYQELQNRASFGGKVGGLSGSIIPYALDPVLMPSWFMGYGEAATGARLMAGLGKVALAEAGLESISQVFQYQWKDEISEASLEESLTSIAAVTGVTLGLGATAIGLSKGLQKLLKNVPPTDIEGIGQNWARHKVQQMADEMFDVRNPVTEGRSHVEAGLKLFEEEFGFKPNIIVHGSVKDAPKHLRESIGKRNVQTLQAGATGFTVRGARTKAGVYHIIADASMNPELAMRTIWHETVGHEYFKTLKPTQIDALYGRQSEAIEKWAKRQGFDTSNIVGKRKATEEFYVRAMTANLESAFSKRATTAIKKTALEHARKLQAEDKHLNEVHLKHKVRNVTQIPDTDDEVLDTAFNRILEENPDLEIPERIEVVAGQQEVISAKAPELMKRYSDQIELANKYKECIVG